MKALPEARKDEEPGRVKEAKQAFSRTKKELAAITKAQRERLYAAMCTQRVWRFEDWDVFLHLHPVVRHLTTGIVWSAELAGSPSDEDGESTPVGTAGAIAFRPLGDGSLSSADHDAVTLAPDARVRVAHGSLLGAEEVAAWSQHLDDFKIIAPFRQLGRASLTLAEDAARSTELTTFQGHMIDSFALRGRATTLGYTRGPAEDGGWYFRYEKRFPGLGLTTAIEFTGAPLPEEKRLVALRPVSFERSGGGERGGGVPLGEVPAVLLSEAYADVAEIAAAGTGFDPAWEAKTS